MSMSALVVSTSYITTGALGASLVKTLISKKKESRRIEEIRKLEIGIFAVATGQYVLSLNIKDFRQLQRLRYLDWIITTPMLLRTLYLLAEEKGFAGSFLPALGFNILMIVSGYIADFSISKRNRTIFLLLGFVAFAGVLKYVYEWGTYLKSQGSEVDDLLKFFYFGWTVYGLNFMTPNENLRQTIFNISDLFNKAVYALVLEDVIAKKF